MSMTFQKRKVGESKGISSRLYEVSPGLGESRRCVWKRMGIHLERRAGAPWRKDLGYGNEETGCGGGACSRPGGPGS